MKKELEYVREYFESRRKEVYLNNMSIQFYVRLKGYIKIHNRLSDIKLEHFGKHEYILFEEVLSKLSYNSMPYFSGALYLREKDSRLNKNVFYKARNKLVKLDILVSTPFRSFYIVNPDYVIKMMPNQKPDEPKIAPSGK